MNNAFFGQTVKNVRKKWYQICNNWCKLSKWKLLIAKVQNHRYSWINQSWISMNYGNKSNSNEWVLLWQHETKIWKKNGVKFHG